MSHKHLREFGSLLVLGWVLTACGSPKTDAPQPGTGTMDEAPSEPTGDATSGADETHSPDETPWNEEAPGEEETPGGDVEPAPDDEPEPSEEEPTPDDGPTEQVDADGVLMLFPSNPDGASWSLGTRDPNKVDQTYFDLNGDKATARTENGISYWTTTGHKVSYASGAPDGVTVRLNIKASGGTQKYTWRNGAIEHGYLSNPKDLKNFEATVYVRVHDFNNTHDSMNWKLRGGRHSSSNAALSSCTEMSVPYGGDSPKAGRELDHPDYDSVKLKPKFSYQLQAGKWLAVKVVSYLIEGGTKNLLYLDTEPFDANGEPRNNFRLYTEWVDEDGKSTGRYSRAATWGGWVTTFRVDGWKRVDFTHLSAREIIPPAP